MENMGGKSSREIREWYQKLPKMLGPGEVIAAALEWAGPKFAAFVKSNLGTEGKKTDASLGAWWDSQVFPKEAHLKRRRAEQKATEPDPVERDIQRESPDSLARMLEDRYTMPVQRSQPQKPTGASRIARIKEKEARRLALLKKAITNQTSEPERRRNLDNQRVKADFPILDKGVRSGDERYRKTLPPRLPTPTNVSVPPGGLPDSGDQDSILFNFDAEKASSVSAKTISKGVWESLLSGGTTSPRGDIGDSGTFEHPEGRPDLRRGGLTATTTNTNNKNKKRSDARTNRIVAEYSKIKKSKKKVATNNGKKRTK
jgi:hypothetical protein